MNILNKPQDTASIPKSKYSMTIPTRQDPLQKYISLDMLKESAGLFQIGATTQQPKQEFIDHTLLAPGYIRESNNLMMDLMDQQVVFQKPVAVSSSGFEFAEREHVQNSDIQFHNAIFQFVNKQGQIQCSAPEESVVLGGSTVADSSNCFNNKLHTNFITINGNFMADTSNTKAFDCNGISEQGGNNEFSPLMNASLETICDLPRPKQGVSELSLLEGEALNASGLIPESELLCSLSNARKVLPHKKRISKKLKDTENNSFFSFATDEKEKTVEHRANVANYNCEICGHITSSQMDFFAHLKQHYEPAAPDTLLPIITPLPSDVIPSKMFIDNTCLEAKKFEQNSVTQVFPDVHINFEDFPPVDDSVVRAISEVNENDDMKILNSNSIEKCINFVSQSVVQPPKLVTAEEVEFSDTEDMLEGIRNVVDKVSIEDTCDAMDMMTSNTIRTSWFSSTNLNGLALNNKFIENAVFPTAPSNEIPPAGSNLTALHHADYVEIVKSEEVHDLFGDKNEDKRLVSNSDFQEMELPKAENKSITELPSLTSEDELTTYSQLRTEVDAGDELLDTEETKRHYCCTHCHRDFNSNNALKYHNKTHTGVRPHKCGVCGRSFFAQGALKSHIRTHTGEKPFECQHCDRKFRQMGDLKYHITSIHNDIKVHQCEFCGKAFSRKYSLVLHRRIHTSERDYKCEFCPKTFRASVYLQNHRKIHTGEKPYQCPTCSKTFRICGDLRRHSRIHQRKDAKKESGKST